MNYVFLLLFLIVCSSFNEFSFLCICLWNIFYSPYLYSNSLDHVMEPKELKALKYSSWDFSDILRHNTNCDNLIFFLLEYLHLGGLNSWRIFHTPSHNFCFQWYACLCFWILNDQFEKNMFQNIFLRALFYLRRSAFNYFKNRFPIFD